MRKRMGMTAASMLLAASLASGCDNGGGIPMKNRSDGSDRPPDKLSILKPLYPGHVYHPDSSLEKLVEKALNVELTYETPINTEYKAKLAVKMAGGDIADIVNTFSPNDPEHNALIDQGVFLALDEWLPKFPRLKEAFSEQTWEYMRNPKDGKIYGVPWMRDRGGSGLIIRRDWLDALGLKPPTTLDGLIDVLKAFRDRDPDGNGRNDTIPLTFKDHQVTNLHPLLTLFGLNPAWHPDPSDPQRLRYGLIQPEAKEAIKLARSLRNQGLLDPDMLVGKTLGIDKFVSGKAGVLVTVLGDYRQIAVQPQLRADILDPIEHRGRYWSLMQSASPISRTNQISSRTKHPEAALRYLEYQIADGFDFIQYGVEGKTYKVEDGVKIPFDAREKDPQYGTNVGLELVQPEWLFSDPEKYTKFVPKPTAEYMISKLDSYERYIMYDYLRPNISFPLLQEKSIQLRQIVEEGYIKMLLDPRIDVEQAFDDLSRRWKEAGGDRVTEEVNALQKDKSTPSYTYRRKS